MYPPKKTGKYYWILFACILIQYGAKAQACPPNIGFDSGNFSNWEMFIGRVSSSGVRVSAVSSPEENRHLIFKNSTDGTDAFGLFPIACPNGSKYGMKLGNAVGGSQAERVSYTFTVPAGRNNFSLIYYYAVVLQNPGHSSQDQPRFTAKVFNVNKDQYIDCSSFEYVASQGLPGFQVSPVLANVLYKSWTPVTIGLTGYAGTTIRLEFTTNDCALMEHFGYAYVDVDENCFSTIPGSVVCNNGTELTLGAPSGFSSYKWFNGDFSQVLGNERVFKQSPAPPENTSFAVELALYPGRVCIDTFYATVRYSKEVIDLNVTQAAVENCINEGADITRDFITSGSTPGLTFAYYTDPELKNRYLQPGTVMAGGTYYIKATNADGCSVSKPLTVKLNPLPVFAVANPKPVSKPGTLDITKLVSTAGTLSYWMDEAATISLANPASIDKNGTYYIKITSAAGCFAITSVTASFVNPSLVLANVFSPNGDGINDTWEIEALKYYPECTVEIYTRSGQLLSRFAGYEKPWDGKYNGRDLPVGTYYYVIRTTQNDPPVAGSVTIVR